MDKVQGGTPKGFQSKCVTCRAAHRMIGLNLQSLVHCAAMQKIVAFPVAECSNYDDKRNPALWEMEKIAWEVKSRNRGAVGFTCDSRLEVEITPPDRDRYNPGIQTPQPSGKSDKS